MKMLASLLRLRNELELDQKDSDDICRAAASLLGPLDEETTKIRGDESLSRSSSEVNPDSPDVFLSYSWGNKPAAKRLKKVLAGQGLKVWMDEVLFFQHVG